MDEFIQDFLVEAGEILDQLDHDFIEFEKNPDSKELIARIFRAVHTLKGTGGSVGLQKLELVNHVGEDILSRIRDGKLRISERITSALLRMIDVDRQLLASVASSGEETAAGLNAIVDCLTEIVEQSERASTDENSHQQSTPESTLRLGEILIARDAVAPESITAAIELQREGDPRMLGQILVDSGAAPNKAVQEALQTQAQIREEATSSSIRVDVRLLDSLMDLVGELVLARNQVLRFTCGHSNAAFVNTAQRLNLITSELQEAVMKTRMQPIGNVWNKFPRIVRDISNSTGKSVRLEMEGSQTELDRTIIEAINDPLTHIVRNSLDHGIEPPEERERCGKARQGHLSVRAFHECGQVNIEISDDGAGLDLDAVKAKAVERGMLQLQDAAKMSDSEIANLIFLPGFSTAKQVTNISGRGVGMDVVKTNVQKIGGSVDVSSVRGRGTTLKIKIPLTLSIIPALIVHAGGERFAIPQVSLVELLRLEGSDVQSGIEKIQHATVCRLRGNLLPLIYLSHELKLEGKSTFNGDDTALNIVVVQSDDHRFGLVVDGILDTEEIVVKPLSKHLRCVPCFSGATLMGDGRVALIVDIVSLAQKASIASNPVTRHADAKESDAADVRQRESWLIFRAGQRNRLALPLSTVNRLEEVQPSLIEYSSGREVVQYRDEIMPLLRLADALQVPQSPCKDKPLQVVVQSSPAGILGLVVDEILEIVDQPASITRAPEHSLLVGSAVIQQHVTDLLNIPALLSSEMTTGRTV